MAQQHQKQTWRPGSQPRSQLLLPSPALQPKSPLTRPLSSQHSAHGHPAHLAPAKLPSLCLQCPYPSPDNCYSTFKAWPSNHLPHETNPQPSSPFCETKPVPFLNVLPGHLVPTHFRARLTSPQANHTAICSLRYITHLDATTAQYICFNKRMNDLPSRLTDQETEGRQRLNICRKNW